MSRALSLAGFQVTLIGRFWVITEGSQFLPIGIIQSALLLCSVHFIHKLAFLFNQLLAESPQVSDKGLRIPMKVISIPG
jgi:hypothetical protein